MKKFIPYFVLAYGLLAVLAFQASGSNDFGILIEELDGDPSGYTYKLKVDNGSLTKSGNTFTLDAGKAAVGGSDTQVQFNDGGDMAGDAGLTYVKSTDTLTASGAVKTPKIVPPADSTTAVQIQTNGGTAIETWDTSNRVQVWNVAGTNPTTSATDGTKIWTQDHNGAGTNAPYYRNEAGQSGVVAHQAPLTNLLTNSGFGVWSQSTLVDIGTQISITGITAGVCATANTQGLAIGKLFRFDAGTVTGTYEVTAVTANTSFTIHDTTKTEASAHTGYEVTPGCVAANALGPDGMTRTTTTPLIYRNENDPTKQNGYYGLRFVKGANTAEYLNLQSLTGLNGLGRVKGRTVTLGAWIYSTTAADNVKLQINDSDGTTESAFVAANGLLWVEVTRTTTANITSFTPRVLFDGATGNVAYVSSPMLVYGPSIGAGNAAQQPGEIVWTEASIALATLHNKTGASGFSDVSTTTLNLEVDSLGKIPKGAKGVKIRAAIRDSASAAGTNGLYLAIGSSAALRCAGIANDAITEQLLNVKCDSNGDTTYTIDASGSNTFDTTNATVESVLVN